MTKDVFLLAIVSSTVLATIIGFALGWVKEFFQKKKEREEKQYEKLYGSLTYNLLAMKVLKINRIELLDEISKEPTPNDTQMVLKQFSDVNPLIDKWNMHKEKLIGILEHNAGYIKKCHMKLIEDFLDGCVKRDITKGGTSHRTTKERVEKMLDAVEALQKELLD